MRTLLAILAVILLFKPAFGQTPEQTPDFMVAENMLMVYTTHINRSLADAVRNLPPSVKIIYFFENSGGDARPATDIAQIVRDRKMSVVVDQRCESACTFILQAGIKRVAITGSTYAVHTLTPADTIENTILTRGWTADLMIRLGMNADFANKYIRNDNGLARLTAQQAKQMGLVTDVVIFFDDAFQ